MSMKHDRKDAEIARLREALARLGSAILNYHDSGQRPTKDELWAMYSWTSVGWPRSGSILSKAVPRQSNAETK